MGSQGTAAWVDLALEADGSPGACGRLSAYQRGPGECLVQQTDVNLQGWVGCLPGTAETGAWAGEHLRGSCYSRMAGGGEAHGV